MQSTIQVIHRHISHHVDGSRKIFHLDIASLAATFKQNPEFH